MDQISRILRPEGLAILGECDFRIYTDKRALPPSVSLSPCRVADTV